MEPQERGEKCVRCGEFGEDRRTLYMACLYAMEELKIGLEQVEIRGRLAEKTGTAMLEMFNYSVPVFETDEELDKKERKSNKYHFYRMRVCKDCRADWMKAIKQWFLERPVREELGTGIFVRDFGTCLEITEEEFYRRRDAKKTE